MCLVDVAPPGAEVKQIGKGIVVKECTIINQILSMR